MTRTYNAFENVEPFCVEFSSEDAHASGIAPRFGKAVYQPGGDDVVHNSDDRDRLRCLLRCAYCCIPGGHDNACLVAYQLVSQLREALRMPRCKAKVDTNVPAINLTE